MKIICDLYSGVSEWGILDPRAISKFKYLGFDFVSVEQFLLYKKLAVYGYSDLANKLLKEGEYYDNLFPEIEKAFDDGPIRNLYMTYTGFDRRQFELYHETLHDFIMATVAKIEQAEGMAEKVKKELVDVLPVEIAITDVVKSEASKSNFCYLLNMDVPKRLGGGKVLFSEFLDAGYDAVLDIMRDKRYNERKHEEEIKKDGVDEE